MRSISIINTGIQLINIIEAIKYTECNENYLIIGQFNIFPERIRQIEEMLEDDFLNQHFKKIYKLPRQYSPKNPFRFLGYFFAYIQFLFIVFFRRKFDYCFSGVYTDLMQRPVNFLSYYRNKKIKLWLIDEGARIIDDVKLRKTQEEKIIRQEQKRKNWIRDFYYGFTKKWIPPYLTYFSVYDLHILKRDNIVANEYLYLKNNNIYRGKFEGNAIIIIGQPYPELKMLPKERYIKILNEIITYYKNNKIYYVPHPIETYYFSYLSDNVEIIKTKYPVELLLLGSNIKSLIGFTSSVLINAIKMKICNEIKSYIIAQEELENINKEAYQNAINYMEGIGIKQFNKKDTYAL